jgi:ABC-type uncharacterized transport system substrate-binding protein
LAPPRQPWSARSSTNSAGKLRELGHVEGENIAIEYRWAEDTRLANLAAELVRLKPDVIMTTGSPGTFAAKQATDTIPIIFMGSSIPAERGLVAGHSRPVRRAHRGVPQFSHASAYRN